MGSNKNAKNMTISSGGNETVAMANNETVGSVKGENIEKKGASLPIENNKSLNDFLKSYGKSYSDANEIYGSVKENGDYYEITTTLRYSNDDYTTANIYVYKDGTLDYVTIDMISANTRRENRSMGNPEYLTTSYVKPFTNRGLKKAYANYPGWSADDLREVHNRLKVRKDGFTSPYNNGGTNSYDNFKDVFAATSKVLEKFKQTPNKTGEIRLK